MQFLLLLVEFGLFKRFCDLAKNYRFTNFQILMFFFVCKLGINIEKHTFGPKIRL